MAGENQAYTSATVEETVQRMEVQAVNFAYRFVQDARVRSEYMKSTKEMAEQIRGLYAKGDLTAKQTVCGVFIFKKLADLFLKGENN